MSIFAVRVELHRADEDDYLDLHEAMERAGFSRIITGSTGTEYRLPTAEYNAEGNYGGESVLEAAKKAASSAGKDFAVLVSESTWRRWHGLQKAY